MAIEIVDFSIESGDLNHSSVVGATPSDEKTTPPEDLWDRMTIACGYGTQPYPDASWYWNMHLQNWVIFGINVNVGKYTIHGAYGVRKSPFE